MNEPKKVFRAETRFGRRVEISARISSLLLLVRKLRRLEKKRNKKKTCARLHIYRTLFAAAARSRTGDVHRNVLARARPCTCISRRALLVFSVAANPRKNKNRTEKGERQERRAKKKKERRREGGSARVSFAALPARRAAKESRVPLHNHLTHGTFCHANLITSGRPARRQRAT